MIVTWKDKAHDVVNDTMLGLTPHQQWILHTQVEYVNSELATVPDKLGESRFGRYRLWYLGVLEIYFEIIDHNHVSVVLVRINKKAWDVYDDPNQPPI